MEPERLELELDESELFDGGEVSMESPSAPVLLASKELAAVPLPMLQSDDLSDASDSDDDGIVLDSEGSSSSEEDEVEQRLQDRILSLQSSLDPADRPHEPAELSTSHRSQVGSLKSFGSAKGKRLFGSEGDLATSMPVATPINAFRRRVTPEPDRSYNLGTSMPISIPMLQRRGSGLSLAEDTLTGAATFVPPHLLQRSSTTVGSTAEEVLLLSVSHAGASPSNDAKREKLKARNAILRRTGFIEIQPQPAAMTELLEPVKQAVVIDAAGDVSNLSSSSAVAGGAMPVPAGAPGSLTDRRLQTSSLTALLGTSK